MIHSTIRVFLAALALLTAFATPSSRADFPASGDRLFPDAVSLPSPGATDLRILTPEVIEVRGIDGRAAWDAPLSHWRAWESADLSIREPSSDDFEILIDGKNSGAFRVGFRREPIFANYWTFDLRILNSIFFQLEKPIPDGGRVEIIDRTGKLWPTDRPLAATLEPARLSPLIHINHAGYAPSFPKFAFVSGDLGTLGELRIPSQTEARLVDENGKTVFRADLAHRADVDWKWHQEVWRFDFSEFREEGMYRIEVDGLGQSARLRIHDAAFAYPARLHALGMFHQRSGFEKKLPFTRIEHAASHTRPAFVPTVSSEFKNANRNLQRMVGRNSGEEQHLPDKRGNTAPPLTSFNQSLFPFVNRGTVDVSGGHYDAGDYSKYMVNSAQLVSALIFATDNFPGVDKIDNLGLPESGDGIPDALQEAKWEADFILKMRDADGGFYFLVYPRERSYELDVLPENGDPQVVFPKTLISTAAAVGALAQCAASPAFRRHFPDDAERYLVAARAGWELVRRAVAERGIEGASQIISHYGLDGGGADELCYAAAALFAATGEKAFEADLMRWWPEPEDGQATKWGWLPLIGAYGAAARVYAFSESPGRLPPGSCNAEYLGKMRAALLRAADTFQQLSLQNAFGIPLSLSSKRSARVGWFLAMEYAFDLATATLLEPDTARRQELIESILACSNFEFGANPSNRVFVSGAGPTWRRQIVNRISLNDRRVLAPSGIASGNVVSTPDNLRAYQIDGAAGLRRMYHPSLADFPFYDRSALDAYNVRAEAVTSSIAKILATYLFLHAQTAEATRPWASVKATILGAPDVIDSGKPFSATLSLPEGFSADDALVVWEVPGEEPTTGREFHGCVRGDGAARLEAEVVWPDGRRAFAVHHILIRR